MKRLVLIALAATVMACGSDVEKGKNPTPVNTATNVQPGSNELVVGQPSGPLVEGAPPITVALNLTRAPTAPVTVTVTSQTTEVVVEPTQLTFDATTFEAQQRVSVSVTDNREVTGDRTGQLTFSLASEDVTFAGKPVNPLNLTVVEDDATPSYDVVSDTGAFEVAEDGSSIVLDVTLSVQPDGDVLVPLRIDDADEAQIDVTQMTFGELTWNIPQQVTVTGLDDMEADGDTTFNLVLGPSNSTGETYNGAPEFSVSIVNIDGVCGNGIVDGSEPCEPMGNPSTTCDYGEMSCTYCSANCTEQAGTVTGYCGDGTVQAGDEECDAPTQRCPYGQMSCTTCSNCQEVAGQPTGYCGDGIVQANNGEACDPAVSACCNNSCQVDTANCGPDCMIISEYYEGPQMDKAVEIYNCGTQTEPLAGITLCLHQNADMSCTRHYSYTGTLAAGDVFTICNSNATDPDAQTVCDDFETGVTQFNGDDRLALFVDLDDDGFFDTGSDIMLDAFGELNRRGMDGQWANQIYDRCNWTPYLGSGTFNVDTYYDAKCSSFCPNRPMLTLDDPPVQGCP